ncbi:MAG: PQ-loop repeat-containing protein [Patescibacteria group bacterium]|nr:PQ-loop repeat-containing protein [Patescibacteria group bacterium]
MDIFKTLTFAGIVGFLTATMGVIVKVIGLPDQIRKNHKRKSTEGLSTTFIVLTLIAYALWTLHGFLQKDNVLIIGQGIGIITTGIILWQIIRYKKRA